MGPWPWLFQWAASLALVGTIATFDGTGQEVQSQREIGRLIEDLSNRDAAVRDAAMDTLASAGQAAIPALEAAAASGDPETATRARILLRRLELGIEPQLPREIITLAVRAREDASAAARAAARQRLAQSPPAAPVVAQLVIDALAEQPTVQDPPELVLRDLWPQDRWILAAVTDTLLERGQERVLVEWLERIAAAGNVATAAANFAWAAREFDQLPAALARWEQRAADAPTAIHLRIVRALRFAAQGQREGEGSPRAAGALRDGGVRDVALALLAGHDGEVAALVARQPEGAPRLSLELLAARAVDAGPGFELAAREALARWLIERSPAIEKAVADVGPVANPAPPELEAARSAMLAAILLGDDLPRALALADAIEPVALLRLHFRRLEFDKVQELVARHNQRHDRAFAAVRAMYAQMSAELRPAGRSESPASLSDFAARRLAAAGALRRGDRLSAETLADLERLSRADPGDPALRWLLGQALAQTGQHSQADLGRGHIHRALALPLADAWVRRGLADELWLAGEREAALEQYHIAATWALFSESDALSALEIYASRLNDAGKFDRARRVLAAAQAMLLDVEIYADLNLTERGSYYAFYLAAELERARMNLAADAGDWPAAEAAWRRSYSLLPLSEASIDLINKLDEADRSPIADRVFVTTYAPLVAAVARYPQSSILNNQVAWLAASCNRQLDAALNYAKAAVDADGSSPAALDTLVEVHLRRGELERARELVDEILILAEQRDAQSGAPVGQFNDYVARRERFLQLMETANTGGGVAPAPEQR